MRRKSSLRFHDELIERRRYYLAMRRMRLKESYGSILESRPVLFCKSSKSLLSFLSTLPLAPTFMATVVFVLFFLHFNTSWNVSSFTSCSAKTHVGFLKTHKMGSTTMATILARLALTRNVPAVVPPIRQFWWLCKKQRFARTRKCMIDPHKVHNMLFHHVKFPSTVKRTIPPDSYWFTVVRDPVGFFESTYIYYKAKKFTGVNFDTFISDHRKYLEIMKSKGIGTYRYLYSLETDLGFKFSDQVNSSTVIQFMEEQFSLVIVSKYYDHGLCYLKRQLCWTFDDIVYLKQNQRSRKRNYTEGDKEYLYSIVREVIPVYVEVYEYFEKKFRERMLNDIIDQDVRILRNLNQEARNRCLSTTEYYHGSKQQIKDPRLRQQLQPVPIATYQLKNEDNYCFLLALPFDALTFCLQLRQMNLGCDPTFEKFAFHRMES